MSATSYPLSRGLEPMQPPSADHPACLDRLAAFLVANGFGYSAGAEGEEGRSSHYFRRGGLYLRFVETIEGWRIQLNYRAFGEWHDADVVGLYLILCGERMTVEEEARLFREGLDQIALLIADDSQGGQRLRTLAAIRPRSGR